MQGSFPEHCQTPRITTRVSQWQKTTTFIGRTVDDGHICLRGLRRRPCSLCHGCQLRHRLDQFQNYLNPKTCKNRGQVYNYQNYPVGLAHKLFQTINNRLCSRCTGCVFTSFVLSVYRWINPLQSVCLCDSAVNGKKLQLVSSPVLPVNMRPGVTHASRCVWQSFPFLEAAGL